MSKIELSAGMASGLPARILTANATGSSIDVSRYGLLQQGLDYSYYPGAVIYIMKGTMPTNFSTLSTEWDRGADILARFTARSGHFAPTVQTTNPATINTIYVSATAAGTATWFRWGVFGSVGSSAVGVPYHQIIGTVGEIGSGADLEMVSTTLAVGDQTRITNFRISFPTSWTY